MSLKYFVVRLILLQMNKIQEYTTQRKILRITQTISCNKINIIKNLQIKIMYLLHFPCQFNIKNKLEIDNLKHQFNKIPKLNKVSINLFRQIADHPHLNSTYTQMTRKIKHLAIFQTSNEWVIISTKIDLRDPHY